MNKIILTGTHNNFPPKTNKWIFSINGIFLMFLGIGQIVGNVLAPFNILIGILSIIIGGYNFFYGLFGFSENSRLSPKVRVDDSEIELKSKFWKPSITLKWTDLSSIKFQSYEIIFQVRDSSNSFTYNSNSNVSIAIKQNIREFAERKNIEIIGS